MKVMMLGSGARHDAVRAAVLQAGHEIVSHETIQVGVCVGWPQILKAHELALPIWGWINCHAGPVPEYRGGSPLNWQIINGASLIGVSVLKMTEGIDDGPVLAEQTFNLLPEEDISHAHAKANALFAGMVPQVLERIALGEQPERRQIGPATYWHQRDDSDGEIDWSWSAVKVHNFVRALARPYPGAWALTRNPRNLAQDHLRVWKTSLDCPEIKGRPGHIFNLQGKRYAVCGDRALQILE
jgi:methionyl-tRNA formyltransferase